MKLFPVYPALSEQQVRQGLRAVIRDGLTTQTMNTLIGGALLVDFAIRLGASNLTIGMMAAITPLAQLLQIPSVFLIERYRNRRAITVGAVVVSRSCLLLLPLIPFLFPPETGSRVLLLALAGNVFLAAPGNCSWNSWMRDLIPQERLGAFFAKRMMLASALSIAISLSAGYFIEHWKTMNTAADLGGYALLFVIGGLAGLLGAVFIGQIPEPALEPARGQQPFFSLLKKPFEDGNFRNLIWFLASWNFAVNLALPFFSVYLLKTLQLPISTVVVFSVVNQVVGVAFLGIWGKYTDRFSNKTIMSINGMILLLCILAFTFTHLPEQRWLTLGLLAAIYVFLGVSTSGVNLVSGNIGLKLAPRGQATSYLAAISIVNSLASGLAPILGGQFADYFAACELSWTLRWTAPGQQFSIQTLNFQHWDFFFVMAFLAGLYSMHRLALVKESNEVKEDVVLRELMAEVKRKSLRFFSNQGTWQLLFQLPFSLWRHVKPAPAKDGTILAAAPSEPAGLPEE